MPFVWYWHVNSSKERLVQTRSLLQALLKRCEASQSVIDRIDTLTAENEYQQIDWRQGFLGLAITKQLIHDSLKGGPTLESRIKNKVEECWRSSKAAVQVDFVMLCMSSKSTWDAYIAGTTPDQPARLAYDLSSIVNRNEFELFWSTVNAKLSTKDAKELRDWYRRVGQSMTGEPLELPEIA